jgi:hypothetical protein
MDRPVERHDSAPNATTTIIVRTVDGVAISRAVALGDAAAASEATLLLDQMATLHDAAVLQSWELLIQQTTTELAEREDTPCNPRCASHDCPIRVFVVSGNAEGKTFMARDVLDGGSEDHFRRVRLRRAIAESVIAARGITLSNHRFWLAGDHFETKTEA